MSELTDAAIAQLIGDKTGPVLISEAYGDVRPDHLLAVARKIQLTAKTRSLGQRLAAAKCTGGRKPKRRRSHGITGSALRRKENVER